MCGRNVTSTFMENCTNREVNLSVPREWLVTLPYYPQSYVSKQLSSDVSLRICRPIGLSVGLTCDWASQREYLGFPAA
jgi:hypothetical protein